MTKKAERYQSKIDRVYGVEKFEIISISTKYGKDKLRCLTCNKLFLTELDDFVKNKIGCQNKTNGSCYKAIFVQDNVNAVHGTDIVVLKSDGKLTTKTVFKCNTCDNQWETTLQSVLNGSGCQSCSGRKARQYFNTDDELEKLYTVYGDAVKLEYYCGELAASKSVFMWTQCGHRQTTSLSAMLYNTFYVDRKRCAECIRIEKEKNYHIIVDDFGFSMSEYKTTAYNAIFTCNYCNKSIKTKYHYIVARSRRCTCKQAQTLSLGENAVNAILKALSINFIEQHSFDKLLNRYFDFFLPDYNLVIEFNGEQHYSPVKWSSNWTDEKMLEIFQKQKERDSEKRAFCKETGIDLYEIKWDSEKWESKLLNYLKFI